MTPIPPAVRGVLETLPRMKRCTLEKMQDRYGECEGRITKPEWHHVWIYAGRQIQEVWAILAGCTKHHAAVQSDFRVARAFERESLKIASDADLAEFPRKPWAQMKVSLGL